MNSKTRNQHHANESDGSDKKEDERNQSKDSDNESLEMAHENNLNPTEPIDKESGSTDGSKRGTPVQLDERESKKTASPRTYKPNRRYPNRDSYVNRHSQETKRLRNSSLAPLLRDGVSLGGILGDIPDYYTDGGETIFTEVTVQFLNAQVRSLKEELETLIRECVDKDELILLLEQRLKETEIDRTKLQRENSNKEQQIEKLEKSLDEAKEKGEKMKKELTFLTKEFEILKQGQRQATTVKSNLEAKLARVSEENERIKSDIRQVKQTSKEAQETYQRKMEELTSENRRIEKQNSELHNAIKKQMQLINNLKRQKMHIEAATAVQFSEEEFMKALDRGF